jgi:predicted component of viral defense system (DUF524 family)
MEYSDKDIEKMEARIKKTFDEKDDAEISRRLARLEDYYDYICLLRDLFHNYVAERILAAIEKEAEEGEPQLSLPENVDWDAEMEKLFNEDG